MKPGDRVVVTDGPDYGTGTVVDAPDLRERTDVVAVSFAEDLEDDALWHLFVADQLEPAP